MSGQPTPRANVDRQQLALNVDQANEEVDDGSDGFDSPTSPSVSRKAGRVAVSTSRSTEPPPQSYTCREIMMVTYVVLIESDLKYFLLVITATVLGLLSNPMFIAMLCIDVFRLEALRRVMQAVSTNLGTLSITLFGFFVMIFIFTVIGFHGFPELYVDRRGDPYCSSLWHCVVFTVSEGMRAGGGIGDLLQSPEVYLTEDGGGGSGSYDEAGLSMYIQGRLFQLVFWLLMVVIGLNIIAGIIIDQFASLRAQQEARAGRENNFCIVCGLDRNELDRRGAGFEKHKLFEHDIWAYAYLFYHMKKKPTNLLTGALFKVVLYYLECRCRRADADAVLMLLAIVFVILVFY